MRIASAVALLALVVAACGGSEQEKEYTYADVCEIVRCHTQELCETHGECREQWDVEADYEACISRKVLNVTERCASCGDPFACETKYLNECGAGVEYACSLPPYSDTGDGSECMLSELACP